jgi:acyl-CoA synthetase (AMP-forming)/AMP-acid ligase II
MILDQLPPPAGTGVDAALDDLFRAAAARRPDAIALTDPPNRARFTDGAARQLTYAEADRMISAIAGRLRQMGLHADAVVGLQIANTVESVLTFLAVLRAELIAMPLPLLWRRADAIGAVRRAGAGALIVSGRIGATDHFDLAINAAAEAFTVRQVCGFGPRPPDGAVSLDDLYAAAEAGSAPTIISERAVSSARGAHLAAVTWDVSADGAVPVARSDAQLIAGGLAVLLESRIPQNAVILSTIPLSSFAGIAMTLVPWLVVGGTLALHHPFDDAAFAEQCRELRCDAVVVPGPLVAQLAAAGYLSAAHDLASVIAAWRAPEQLRRAPDWRDGATALIDVQLFGEIGLVAARRGQDGRPVPIPLGAVLAPRDAEGALIVAEVAATANGTLALRGPMVPRGAFPPGAEKTSLPRLTAAADGFVDTGYAGAVGPAADANASQAMAVNGPPAGLVIFGGYRFAIGELANMINGLDSSGTLAVRPDPLAGHRLAGTATNQEAIRMALRGIGANPLLVEAFDARPKTTAGTTGGARTA